MIIRTRDRTKSTPKFNWGIIFLLCFIVFFAYRVFNILKENSERGSLAYVQMLNFGLPVVQEGAFDEADYHESIIDFKYVVVRALGLDNISHFGLINNEISFFKNGFSEEDSSLAGIKVNPFTLKDESISKVEPTASKVVGVYNENLKQEIDHTKPRVLIYHTHTTEGYDGGNTTNDYSKNVVAVGEELTRILEEDYGVSVIHDKTNHYLDFANCYSVSGETVKAYLQKYGDFDLIIDLHRDGVPNKSVVTSSLNDENLAKIMFVLAGNSSRNDKNTEVVDKFEGITNELFPGLLRKRTVWGRGKCGPNLGLSDGSIVLEVGGNTNTSQEAVDTAKYIGRIIAEYLNRK